MAARPDDSLSTAINSLLEEESSRSEGRVAFIRFLAYTMVVVLDVVLYFAHQRPITGLWSSVPFCALASVLLVVTRRHFRPWVSYAVPLLDAAFIVTIMNVRVASLGLDGWRMATGAVACALFAATGGVRFSRPQWAWTTSLALISFLAVFGWRGSPWSLLYTLMAIGATGILSGWQADLARRALEGERGRAVLKRFLHGDVVDQAFSDPYGLSLAPREVEATVLVSDLRGFTALSESLSPVDVLELLSGLQGELADAVAKHGGAVDKFLGDGMLATFGAVRENPEHEASAVRCALDIQQRLEALNQRRTGAPLRLGIGIHTGPLVAGTVGSADRLEFTVIGDTVNTASRLESITKELGVSVAVSETTAKKVTDVALEPVTKVTLRGRSAAIEVFGLKAPAAAANG